jgi:hypothetical protein
MRRQISRFVISIMLVLAPRLYAQDTESQPNASVPPATQGGDQKAPDCTIPHDETKCSKLQDTTEEPVKNRLVVVGPPKVYDDYFLQNLLSSLQSQLTSIHAVDQATLLSHIGVAQGANLNQTSAAFSVAGMPTPQVSTFSLAPGVPPFSYPPGYTGPQAPGATAYPAYPTGVATATTPGTTTTNSSVTPTPPTPPTPTLAPPTISSLGQSSLDTYNESLQLSSEIPNTVLLLQGALSDEIDHTKATIGFPITVEAPSISDKDLAGAVAEVRVSLCSIPVDEPPSIVTLLPQERTYNVASLVEKNLLGSAGAVLGGVINVGGGFLWSHKRYYLVQQQETVAMLDPADPPKGCGANKASFAWQIHPVLGNDFLRPGNSTAFVQFAVPASFYEIVYAQKTKSGTQTYTLLGKACVSVAWRKPAVNLETRSPRTVAELVTHYTKNELPTKTPYTGKSTRAI